MDQQYCAFISYRHMSPDAEAAKRLHTAIETYGIPGSIRRQTGRRRMGKVFRDQEELPLSADLGADIEAALDRSDWLICVCSPRYPQSRWCMREVEYFVRRKGRERVLAVLAEGEPGESFPELLLWDTLENGERTPLEPLAANLRGADRAKFRTESLRLLAPMLGVSFDDLKRRGRQRRIRQACAAGAAALVLAGGITAYALANNAKNERLRLEAEEQQRLALEQQALAEEEARRAQEEAQRAEEERLRAVSNSIGELLERASAHLGEGERRAAAAELLEALDLGDGEGGLRREEVVSLLRRTLYIAPFDPVSGFSDQNVRLLDIVPGPDGKLALGVENGNSAALLDLEANALRYRVKVGNEQIGHLSFSPSGDRFLAICETARMVTVWNTEDGSEAFRYVSRADEAYQISNAFFWKDGETVLVQDMDRLLLVSADGTEKLLYTLGEQQGWYDPGNNLITMIFSRPVGDLLTLLNDDYIGVSLCVSEDRSRILVSGRDGCTGTLILDGEGRCVTPLYGMPGTLAETYTLSADGRVAACVSEFGFLAWWNGETGELMGIDGYDSTRGREASRVVISPEGDRLALVANDELRVYDTASGDILISGTMSGTRYVPFLAYSDDGDWLFLMNQSLYIVNARTGALYAMEEAEDAAPFNNAVQVGDLLFLTRGDGTASLRCMPDLSAVRRLESYTGELCPEYDPARPPEGAAVPELHGEHRLTDAFLRGTQLTDLSPGQYFDREGKRAALFYPDGVIELFDLEGDGSVTAMLGQLTREACALGMTERWLAACDAGGQLLLYDLEEETVLRILKRDSPCVSFAFNAAGDLLMALGADGVADVYDITNARLLFSLRSEEAITDIAFAADGSAALAFTPGYVEAADLWTDEKALLDRARELAGIA